MAASQNHIHKINLIAKMMRELDVSASDASDFVNSAYWLGWERGYKVARESDTESVASGGEATHQS